MRGLFVRYHAFERGDWKRFQKEMEKGFRTTHALENIIDIAQDNREAADDNEQVTEALESISAKFKKLNSLENKLKQRNRPQTESFRTLRQYIGKKYSQARNAALNSSEETILAKIKEIKTKLISNTNYQYIYDKLGIDIQRILDMHTG